MITPKYIQKYAQLSSFFVFFIWLFLLVLLSPSHVDALTMRGANFIIRMGNENMVSGNVSGPNNKLGFTSGELAVGFSSTSTFRMRAGFQYIHSIIPFTFSVSSTTINFGTLTPGEPVLRTNLLTISNGSAAGYQVTASENHALRVNATGQDIPDTTCDSGTCTQTTSAAWTSALTYGFGYRCDNVSGTDCATGFTSATSYKQFANRELSETAEVVMTSANVGRDRQTQITYKVNISSSQPAGLYQNVIQYIATPTF